MSIKVALVVTPVPGVFYRRPAPEQPFFVEEGGSVKAGDTIGLIEVMKTFMPVVSEVAGRLQCFLVEDQGVVAPGQAVAEVAVSK